MINTQGNLNGLKCKQDWWKNHIVNESGIEILIDDFIDKVLSVPFCPYHFVRTILSNTSLSVYHFVHTILSATILS